MRLTDREYRLLGKQFAKKQHEQALRFIEELRAQESVDLPEDQELYELELLIFEE